MKNIIKNPRPSVALLEAELVRMDLRQEIRLRRQCLLSLLAALLCAFALAASRFPVLEVHGSSMYPTLHNGDILLCIKTKDVDYGDITLFYHNNKILVKRLIGTGGDSIDLHPDGQVIRNGTTLQEDYIASRAQGTCDIALPCRVPAGSFFFMGDHRETSMDSRSTTIGCVSQDKILGKAILRIWPLHRFGQLNHNHA